MPAMLKARRRTLCRGCQRRKTPRLLDLESKQCPRSSRRPRQQRCVARQSVHSKAALGCVQATDFDESVVDSLGCTFPSSLATLNEVYFVDIHEGPRVCPYVLVIYIHTSKYTYIHSDRRRRTENYLLDLTRLRCVSHLTHCSRFRPISGAGYARRTAGRGGIPVNGSDRRYCVE